MSSELCRIDGVIECMIVKRLNRFVAEVLVDGSLAKAYVNNTGRLLEYMVEGKRAYCLASSHLGKTRYRLFAVDDCGLAAVIDTWMQTRIFEKAVSIRIIPWLKDCRIVRRNVRLGRSLIDYLVDCKGKLMYLEVKSAILRSDGRYAMYPDCPTVRGRRHIREIINHVRKGGLGAILFIAALPRVEAFKPNSQSDPVVSELLWEAYEVGVLVKAISMYYDSRFSAVYLDNPDLALVLR